jgi:hypothetical protein
MGGIRPIIGGYRSGSRASVETLTFAERKINEYNWMRSCGVIGVPGELNGVTARAAAEGEVLKQGNRLRQARLLGANVLRVAARLRN